MQKDNVIELKGHVIELLPGANFRIKLETGAEVIAHLSGKMRLNRIRLTIGDNVMVVLSPYDLTKGRITYRF